MQEVTNKRALLADPEYADHSHVFLHLGLRDRCSLASLPPETSNQFRLNDREQVGELVYSISAQFGRPLRSAQNVNLNLIRPHETIDMNESKLPSRRGRNLAPIQYFDLSQSHSDWLDAQFAAGVNKDRIVRAALDEFLHTIEEEEQQRWIEGALAEMPADTSRTDLIVNAALSRFISVHGEEFASV